MHTPSFTRLIIQLARYVRPLTHLLPPVSRVVGAIGFACWPAGLRTTLAALSVAAFVVLTWVRAESLARMLPHVFDLGLGVLAGLLGNTLGHWFRQLGAGVATAHSASLVLKITQIVGVPLGYLLLGGHMLLMPAVGAGVAMALVVVSQRLSAAPRT